MNQEREPLTDRLWNQIKNNKIVAVLIIAGGIISGVASFSESLLSLWNTTEKFIPEKQETVIIKTDSIKPGILSNDYFEKNFQAESTGNSDVVNTSKEDILIDLSINNKDENLKYVLKKTKGHFEINPHHSYLTLLQNGGPIKPIDVSRWQFGFQFPTLDFKVINNSDKTVYFTKAIISVAGSRPDLFPVILIGAGSQMQFSIRNIGWGKVYNCSLRFNIVTTDQNADFNSDLKYEVQAGDFDDLTRIDLGRFFRELGVDTEIVSQYEYEEMLYNNDSDTINNRILAARGPFRNDSAKIYGEIIYEGINASGNRKKETLRFENSVLLGPPGEGMVMPPSYTYDLLLETNKSNYSKEIALSQVIKPGEPDRFDIKIAAPMSSRHQFDITLFYNDNKQFKIPGVHLNYFLPRPDSLGMSPSKPGNM